MRWCEKLARILCDPVASFHRLVQVRDANLQCVMRRQMCIYTYVPLYCTDICLTMKFSIWHVLNSMYDKFLTEAGEKKKCAYRACHVGSKGHGSTEQDPGQAEAAPDPAFDESFIYSCSIGKAHVDIHHVTLL